MKLNKLRIRFFTQAILSVPLLFLSADAFSQTPFYQGKTVTIIQGTEAGGSSDVMTREIPKSVTFTRPSANTRIFAGFTSRCTIPWA